MRVAFMGTPAFAVVVLDSLLEAGHDVVGVYTQPDRGSGRGRRPTSPPVKLSALARGLRVYQPDSLRTQAVYDELASLSPEVIAVAAYGRFLPAAILSLPPLGCLNVHPSLLPAYRGASPVAAAILNGDELAGVTVMQISERMDGGPILAQRETAIGADENAEALTARLFELGGRLLVEVLPGWSSGNVQPRPQDESKATVTRRLTRDDGRIEWGRSAVHVARQVRAYHPWPGAFTRWQGRMLKVTEASAAGDGPTVRAAPGQVGSMDDGSLAIGTGDGLLVVRRLQLEGKRAIGARDFVAGHPDVVGATVG